MANAYPLPKEAADMLRGMDVLLVLDPLESLNPDGDSSYVMLTEAFRRDLHPYYVTLPGLFLNGPQACAHAVPIAAADPGQRFVAAGPSEARPLSSFGAVLMRKDPPFDDAFLTATWILDRAGDTLVVNEPGGLRALNEKLAILDFPELIPETRLVRTEGDLRSALSDMGGRMIVKPVFGFGGREILQARDGDPNLSTIFELATHDGARWTVAQAFVEAASEGDKRILLVEGEAIGAVLRVPKAGELRNNFHAGGHPEATELDENDRAICARVGPYLRENGQFFAGIDVIGGLLTEINVTSPTGMQEINALGGLSGDATMQSLYWEALLARSGD